MSQVFIVKVELIIRVVEDDIELAQSAVEIALERAGDYMAANSNVYHSKVEVDNTTWEMTD